MDQEVQFIKSKRDTKILCVDNFLFHVNRNFNSKTYWKCKTSGCRTSAITEGENFVRSRGSHNHSDHGKTVSRLKFLERAKEEIAKDPLKTIPTVFQITRSRHLKEGVESLMRDDLEAGTPTLPSAKTSMYSKRKEFIPQPAKKLADVIIDGEWTKTNDGQNFLLSNDGSEKRILIFGTLELLRRLCLADNVYMDGTFKSCPMPFKQLYTIHCFIMGKMVPIIYGLLPNKTEETYIRFFNLIEDVAQSNGMNFKPKLFQIDFEVAAMNAIKQVFPSSSIRGCYFHFVQCIWRKVQEIGLSVEYRKNAQIKRLVRRSGALPLLPKENLDIWTEIFNEAPYNEKTIQFMDYMTETWVDEIYSKFDKDIWNHYDNDGARTNNHLEGWHASLNRIVQKTRPNLYALIEILKGQQKKNEEDIVSLLTGNSPPKPKKCYSVLDKKIRDLKKTLKEDKSFTPLNFLDAVSNFIIFSSE